MFGKCNQLVGKYSGQENGKRGFVLQFLVPFLVLVISSLACAVSVEVEQPGTPYTSEASPVPRGGRVLGIAITLPEDADYERAFSMV